MTYASLQPECEKKIYLHQEVYEARLKIPLLRIATETDVAGTLMGCAMFLPRSGKSTELDSHRSPGQTTPHKQVQQLLIVRVFPHPVLSLPDIPAFLLEVFRVAVLALENSDE